MSFFSNVLLGIFLIFLSVSFLEWMEGSWLGVSGGVGCCLMSFWVLVSSGWGFFGVLGLLVVFFFDMLFGSEGVMSLLEGIDMWILVEFYFFVFWFFSWCVFLVVF